MRIQFTVLRAAIAADVPALLWGEPGVGKTAVLEELAAKDGYQLAVVLGAVREPTDFNDLAFVQDGGEVLRLPDQWVAEVRAAERPMVLFDDLTSVDRQVQAAIARVVTDRQVGRVALPAPLRIVAAACEPEVAADGVELRAELANSFLHLDWEPDTDRFLTGMLHGFETTIPTDTECGVLVAPDQVRQQAATATVHGFLTVRPDLVHVLPDDSVRAGKAWPSQRRWNSLARILAHLPDGDTAAAALAARGLVGHAASTAFSDHLSRTT